MVHLVSASVPYLATQDVTVVDHYGNLLTGSNADKDGTPALNNARFEAERVSGDVRCVGGNDDSRGKNRQKKNQAVEQKRLPPCRRAFDFTLSPAGRHLLGRILCSVYANCQSL
ncbi:MAG: hypothetical protein VXW22_14010 [Pseudomonadota bacterium]|nr:hypothetical protein [Pseudomonadota bacterium]